MLMLASAATSWAETPATLTQLELKHGDDTQSVAATYHYEYLGKQYTSERVGLDSSSDNISDYHRELYKRLKQDFDDQQPVTCYVDPNEPSSSLLDRELRLELVIFHIPFALGFGCAGFGMIFGSLFMHRTERRRMAKLAEHPDQPWKMRHDWAAGEVVSVRWKPLVALGMFTVLWNSLALPISILFFIDGKQPQWVFALTLLFPLVGMIMLGACIYQVVLLLRSGRSTLRMANVPGVVGGELVGVALVPENIRPQGHYRVLLACLEQQTISNGGDSETKEVSVWEDSRLIGETLSDASGEKGVPIRFVIPSDAKPTDPDADDPVRWQLTVEAELVGPNYKADFEVPVFVTADSQDDVKATYEALSEFELVETLAQQLAREKLLCEQPSDNELRVVCPPLRNMISTAIGIVVSLVFVCVGIGVLWGGGGWGSYFFCFAFTLLGTAGVIGSIGSLLICSELVIKEDRWHLKSGWYGFRSAGRDFTPADIKHIGIKNGMFSSGPTKTTQWNHVVARLADGTKATLVRNLSNRNTERRLIAELNRLAGRTPESSDDESVGA